MDVDNENTYLSKHVILDDDDDEPVINEAPTSNTWTDTHAEISQDNITQGSRHKKTRKRYVSYEEAFEVDPK